MCGPEWGNGGEKVEGEGDATDRKFSTVNGIALRLAPLLSRYFGLDAMSELMVYNPWCESEIYEREVGWYIYIYIYIEALERECYVSGVSLGPLYG